MNSYKTDLMLSVIELNKQILSLFDTEDIVIQRDALLNVLYDELNNISIINETDSLLYSYMIELNEQVNDLIMSKQSIRELCSKK